MGPPVIVWRSPSAEGSGMVSLAPVNNNVVNQLNAIADTPITLIQKGKFAAEHGDRARAKAYFDEAARADPGNTDQQRLCDAGQHVDEGTQRVTVKPLVLPKQEFLKPMAQDKVNKYVIKDPQVKALRDAEVVAYNKLAVADAALIPSPQAYSREMPGRPRRARPSGSSPRPWKNSRRPTRNSSAGSTFSTASRRVEAMIRTARMRIALTILSFVLVTCPLVAVVQCPPNSVPSYEKGNEVHCRCMPGYKNMGGVCTPVAESPAPPAKDNAGNCVQMKEVRNRLSSGLPVQMNAIKRTVEQLREARSGVIRARAETAKALVESATELSRGVLKSSEALRSQVEALRNIDPKWRDRVIHSLQTLAFYSRDLEKSAGAGRRRSRRRRPRSRTSRTSSTNSTNSWRTAG